MSANKQQAEIPDTILDVLRTSGIGYLSVTSGKGELYSYPVAFYFSGLRIYFMTPISAAKLKFIRGNPTVSFLVDNHLLTKGACGAMIQGKAKVYSIAKTVISILSVGPKMASFAKKYPGMFTFYASGKELPDERKLYKYRLIKVEPSKVVYWVGYKFGKYFPDRSVDPLSTASDETKIETFSELLKTADEELPPREVQQSEEWIDNLDAAEKEGTISSDERMVINSHRKFLRGAVASNQGEGKVSESEKKLLGKWKKNGSN